MVRARAELALLAGLAASAVAQVPSPLPDGGPHTAAYDAALRARRDELRRVAPAITEREQRECLDWMLPANPAITHTLLGHHVVVLATEAFAARAVQNDFVLHLDLAYEVLVHLFGVDPCARVGRRFFVWPDPEKDGGHSCNGRELRIHVGRASWSDADGLETWFHEMTHGFQLEHPAGHLMVNGFFEGWAQLMQGVVAEHLAPLGAAFAGRWKWYAAHFAEAGRIEYRRTRLPIEEIVAYDPAAGVLAELVGTTAARGGVDWQPLRALLRDPIAAPPWTPWHLWPARFAVDCLRAFGPEKARPVLAAYRFPLDQPSLDAAVAQTSAGPRPDATPRSQVAEWRVLGPIADPERRGLGADPLGAEHLAWQWQRSESADAPPLPPGTAGEWRAARADERGVVALASDGAPAFFWLATTLPPELRTQLTLFVASDDYSAVWLDGELVHWFRGERACDPGFPDVAYADATATQGRLTVLVVNHGGPAGFALSTAPGGLLFSGFAQRFASRDAEERAAAVAYLASRRLQQPGRALLTAAARDRAGAVRAAACWWPDARLPAARADSAEAEDAVFFGTFRGGFFGTNENASGNQCLARHWGSDAQSWWSMPFHCRAAGKHRVRIRYACPHRASVRVRIRRGERVVLETAPIELARSGPDWNAWAWGDVPTPALEPGVYRVEVFEPAGSLDLDVVALAR